MRKVLFILAELDDADLQWLSDAGSVRVVPDGEVLIPEGQPNHSVYIVLDGELGVLGPGGGAEINRMGQGELVGEISLLDSRPPAVTVTAAGDAKVFTITHDVLRTKMQRDPSFAAHLYRAISIFLANRLNRAQLTTSTGVEPKLAPDVRDSDELSPELMDNLSLAGQRFLTFLDKLQRRES